MNDTVKLPVHSRKPVLIKSQKDWTHDLYKISSIHEQGFSGFGVKIAVIDTGINYNHREFAASIENGLLSYHNTIGDAPFDGNGHGSWCCSRFIGSTFGYVPNAELVSIKSLRDDGSGSLITQYDAFYLALDLGVDIISASIGWPCMIDVEFQNIARIARERGTLIFAAAGNDGRYDDVDAPACYDGVISVAAFNSTFKRSSFSDWSKDVTMYAPGDGKGAYTGQSVAHLSGTSMATPTAGACFALVKNYLKCKNIEVNYDNIKEILTCI